MSKEKKPRINDEITSSLVRLIDQNGQQKGIMPIEEARRIAHENELESLDLVEISPESDPPVCRIMHYHEYKYKLKKRKVKARKKQKQIRVKEIKIRPSTDTADYQVKIRSLMKFLENGNKVKVTLRFRGREMIHPELGNQLLDKLIMDTSSYGTVEQSPKFEGRQIIMVVAPKKKS